MGDVVVLRRSVCPCGWHSPANVAIATADKWLQSFGDADLYYDCPMCGRKHQVHCIGSRVEPREATDGT